MKVFRNTYCIRFFIFLFAFAWQTWSFAAVQSIPPAQIASSLNEQATDALDIVAHHADQLDRTSAKKIAAIFEKEKVALGDQINATQKTNVDDAVAALRNFAEGLKLNLLGKLDNFPKLKIWVNGLDNVLDANLISKLDGLDAVYLAKLETDIASNSMGAGLKTLLRESPDDLNDIWKILKDDPNYAFELSKTGGARWNKWAQGNFFKTVTKAGKDFEELICKQAFKNRSSAKYLELKQKIQADFAKNLDDYEMFSQVQLKYNSSGDYFVADQIFVKYGIDDYGARYIDDMVVIENKLSDGTLFTSNQTSALQSRSYTVRSSSIQSLTNSNEILTQNDVLNFDATIKWYKVHSNGDGSAITGINKID